MKQESRRSFDHSNEGVGEDESKKSQTGDQSLGLKITKILAQDREKLQDI